MDDNGVPTHAHTITVHQPNNSQKGKNEKKKKVEKKKLEKKTSERMEKLKAMAKKRTENKENKPRRDRSRLRFYCNLHHVSIKMFYFYGKI